MIKRVALWAIFLSYEWAFALGAGITVIPLHLKKIDHLLRLDALQRLDFTDHRNRPWDKLLEQLRTVADTSIPGIRVSRDAPEAVRQAVKALDCHNPPERLSAIESLAQMSHPTAWEALAGAVQHPIRDVRINAAFMLARSNDRRAVPGLCEALHDKDWQVQETAARVLGQIGDATAVPDLVDILSKEGGKWRYVVAEALGQIGDATAVPYLIDIRVVPQQDLGHRFHRHLHLRQVQV